MPAAVSRRMRNATCCALSCCSRISRDERLAALAGAQQRRAGERARGEDERERDAEARRRAGRGWCAEPHWPTCAMTTGLFTAS